MAGAAVESTARVIREVDADVLCVVEVEDRGTLDRFNRSLLSELYRTAIVVEGNDECGIDVGMLSRFELRTIRTHVHDTYASAAGAQRVFSRDCAEFEVVLPTGRPLWMLCNHFKSRGYGAARDNYARSGATRLAAFAMPSAGSTSRATSSSSRAT